MPAFIHGFLVHCTVMVPATVIVCIIAWTTFDKLQMLRLDEPFDASDMRTWPLAYAIADAILFALIFVAITSILGDGQLMAAAGAGGAALIAIGAIPLLTARWKR